MEIEFASPGAVEGEPLSVIAVPVFDGQLLSAAAEALDGVAGGAISRALAGARFTGAKGQVLDLIAPGGLHASRLLLVGSGSRDEFTAMSAEALGASAFQAIKASGALVLELRLADLTSAEVGQPEFQEERP